jgi:hypothetical protein
MTTKKRPAWVTFAAIMMFLLGGFSLVSGISSLSLGNTPVFSEVVKAMGGSNFILLGIIDLVLAACNFFAGYSILKGGSFGYIWGIIFAVVNATKWFFMIFWFPGASILIMALDVLILYALVSNPEWFHQEYLGE